MGRTEQRSVHQRPASAYHTPHLLIAPAHLQLMLARRRRRLGHESDGILRAQHAHRSAEHLAHDRKRDLGRAVGAAASQLREAREGQDLPLLAMDPVQARRPGFGAASRAACDTAA